MGQKNTLDVYTGVDHKITNKVQDLLSVVC